MVEKYGLKERSTRVQHFISRFQNDKEIYIKMPTSACAKIYKRSGYALERRVT
jgi:hypothetical protein